MTEKVLSFQNQVLEQQAKERAQYAKLRKDDRNHSFGRGPHAEAHRGAKFETKNFSATFDPKKASLGPSSPSRDYAMAPEPSK